MDAIKKRPSTVAAGLLVRPGAAPTRSTPVEDLPRTTIAALPQAVTPPTAQAKPAPSAQGAGGIKAATIGTTVYLLPAEHKRIRQLALDLDIPSVHELLLLGLDRLLADNGQGPIHRYSPPRPKKG